MISLQDMKKIFIDLKTFTGQNPINEKDLRVLEDKFKIPKEDAYETLYVIYTQFGKYIGLDEILKAEYPNIFESDYRVVARHLFNDKEYAEYTAETVKK